MLRITGWTSDNPFYATDSANDNNASTGTITNSFTSMKPAGALCIIALTGGGENASSSNYSITHGTTNPSWTEVTDVNYNVGASAEDKGCYALAYAITSNTSDITEWEFDIAATNVDVSSLFAVIAEPVSATVNLSPLEVTSAQPNISGGGGTDLGVLTTTTAMPDVTTSTQDNRWTGEDKSPRPTWTGETKS
jgi:hypothetical protein